MVKRLLRNSRLSRHGWRGEFHGFCQSMKFGENRKPRFSVFEREKSTEGLFQHPAKRQIRWKLFLVSAGILVFCVLAAPQCPRRICQVNGDCDTGFFCAKAIDRCERAGLCAPMPEICTEIYAPVCGCDGETYENRCYASAAGVNVVHEGECDLIRHCLSNDECRDSRDPGDSGAYCEKESGNCDGWGVCADRPDGCDDNYDPVCGCDGETYSNHCYAAEVGINVAHEGECETDWHCLNNDDCHVAGDPDEALYCAKEPGHCDGRGVCAEKPDGCFDIYAPVCGCDGETYGNHCFAAEVGTNVLAFGPCDENHLFAR